MVGSVDKARVALKAIRKNIDDMKLRTDADATRLALIQISSALCDVLTMLVEEARPYPGAD